MHCKFSQRDRTGVQVRFDGVEDDKADVILKYMPDEARLLKAYGELPENTRLNEGIANGLDEEDEGAGDDYIEFEDEDIDKI
ncbi:hypothetical protein KY284_024210 [Solanum tuberosum]|nr:hypothetical protein KY284_024210 [Solanum tuberosum]